MSRTNEQLLEDYQRLSNELKRLKKERANAEGPNIILINTQIICTVSDLRWMRGEAFNRGIVILDEESQF